MIPESYIIGSIGSLWIERFPDHHTVNFPKGLVKRISMAPIKNKSGIVSGQYATRISIQWYDEDSTAFDTKMVNIITSMDGLKDEDEIYAVAYEGRTNLQDPATKMEMMNLDFIIKHTL